MIGLPRKNGKSALGAGVALWGLFLGPDGGEVYSVAGDREQARIVFGMAKRMVELDPELSGIAKVWRDAIEVPSTGSVYRVLSSEAPLKEGLSPTLTIFDEVHVQPTRDLWDVFSLASGARPEPLMLGITTAGARFDSHGQDTLCYGLYQHGRRVASGEVDDPTFYFAWWEPRDSDADHELEATWREANPAFDDLVAAEDFRAVVTRTPENEFRTKRCNQWVVSAQSALPFGAWDRLKVDRPTPADGTEVVLGFDGSYSGDSTGLVGCTVEPVPHLFVVEAWERPVDDPHWRVDIADVEATIEAACRRWSVREVTCDPYRWQKSLQDLAARGLPMVEWPTGSLVRIIPAWQKFYDAVMERRFTHDGDVRLARHTANMVLKTDQRGTRPTKEHGASGRKIDLAVCSIIAYDRATQPAEDSAAPWFAFA